MDNNSAGDEVESAEIGRKTVGIENWNKGPETGAGETPLEAHGGTWRPDGVRGGKKG